MHPGSYGGWTAVPTAEHKDHGGGDISGGWSSALLANLPPLPGGSTNQQFPAALPAYQAYETVILPPPHAIGLSDAAWQMQLMQAQQGTQPTAAAAGLPSGMVLQPQLQAAPGTLHAAQIVVAPEQQQQQQTYYTALAPAGAPVLPAAAGVPAVGPDGH